MRKKYYIDLTLFDRDVVELILLLEELQDLHKNDGSADKIEALKIKFFKALSEQTTKKRSSIIIRSKIQ